MNHFLQIFDLDPSELIKLLQRAEYFRKQKEKGGRDSFLKGKNIALFFEKPSLRTKLSFESAVSSLGGTSSYIDGREVAGTRESISDIARVLDRYIDGVFARVYDHSVLQEMANYTSAPILNALCNDHHPFQALAELQVMKWNFGDSFVHKNVVFIGDGCNVPTSLAQGCALLGIDFEMCSPAGYEIPSHFWKEIQEKGSLYGATITASENPMHAIQNADVVVTDTWVSMGMEEEKEQRIKDFSGFTITQDLMNQANANAIFLHCLPAYRGFEVEDEVIEGEASRIFDEVECRLHTAKAVLEYFYGV